MNLSKELINYLSGFISLNSWRDVQSVSLRGMSIPVPTKAIIIGKVKIPSHLSSLIDEITQWYYDASPFNFFVNKNIGTALLKGVYPTEMKICGGMSRQSHTLIKFYVEDIEFIKNKQPSWEDWFIVEESEYATK